MQEVCGQFIKIN